MALAILKALSNDKSALASSLHCRRWSLHPQTSLSRSMSSRVFPNSQYSESLCKVTDCLDRLLRSCVKVKSLYDCRGTELVVILYQGNDLVESFFCWLFRSHQVSDQLICSCPTGTKEDGSPFIPFV